jgi:hypothetical protein
MLGDVSHKGSHTPCKQQQQHKQQQKQQKQQKQKQKQQQQHCKGHIDSSKHKEPIC